MGAKTSIAWCHHTFNAWIGCAKVSPGCDNCYAERGSKRMGVRWGEAGDRRVLSTSYWEQPLVWNRRAEKLGERHRVFCSSMADVFEDAASIQHLEPHRARLAELIAKTQHLDWLLLTKRPENMIRFARRDMGWDGEWPSNVWAGCTVEDQARAETRVPELLKVPARVRFLSCEPLLERVDLRSLPANLPTVSGELGYDWFSALDGSGSYQDTRSAIGVYPRVDWVIVGGESGPKARPFHLEWAREIVRDCQAAGVAPFVKQFGARAIDSLGPSESPDVEVWSRTAKGDDPDEWPADLRVREVPR